MITKPMLPPKFGYVEVEVGGVRQYRNIKTGVLLKDEKETTVDSTTAEPTTEEILDAMLGVSRYE